MNREVKAWTFTHGGFPKALQQTVLPADVKPLLPFEIRVQAKAASINPVDTQLMGFPLWPYLPSFLLPAHKGVAEDFSGVVEEAGTAAGFQAGDEVFGIVPFLPGGTLQQTIRIDTRVSVVVPKPNGWSWEQAAALPLVWLTAQTMIAEVAPFVPTTDSTTTTGGNPTGTNSGGRVVVLGGSSATGMYAIHLAKQRGWSVLASCSGRNADFVRGMVGADDVVDYTLSTTTSGGAAAASVPERVKAFAPDGIIDCVGGTECLGIARRYVTIVGDKTNRMSMGGRNIYLWNPQMFLRALLGKAGFGRSYTCVNLLFKTSFLEESLQLPKEKIIIDSTFDFDQVKEAFEKLNTERTRGKVVVRIE